MERVIEWFVHARRGNTKVTLPAPAGDDEAHAMAAHLVGYGWHDVHVEHSGTHRIPAEVPRRQVSHHAGMTLREFQNVRIIQ